MPRTRCLSSLTFAALVALSSLVAHLPGTVLAQDDDFADAGLVSETEYVSPAHGFQVTWDPAWGIDPDRIDPVLLCNALLSDLNPDIPVFSPVGFLYNRIDIWLPELDARLRITSRATGGDPLPAALVADTSRTMGGNAVTLLETGNPDESVVVHRHARNDGSILISYNELVPGTNPDYWLWIQLIAPEDRFAEAFDRAAAEFESDAFEFGGTITAADILDASEATALTPVSDFGITSGTSWSSPDPGVEVEWVDRFTTLDNLSGARIGSANHLAIAPNVGACVPIDVRVSGNEDQASLGAIVEREAALRVEGGEEVLIASVEGDRGIVLSRSVTSGSSNVTYAEYGLAADGTVVFVAEFESVTGGNAFTNRFVVAAGAVTIEGVPFADTLDPAWIIAATTAPID